MEDSPVMSAKTEEKDAVKDDAEEINKPYLKQNQNP